MSIAPLKRAQVHDFYPLMAVVGPTGSGKSTLALHLAVQFGGEIVNCDSVQVYRGLDIGSAKTPQADRFGIAHHLLDVVEPGSNSEMTAGEYARQAAIALQEIRERGSLPIMGGGTGFYLRALLDGLSPAPARNAQLRTRLTALAGRRPAALHRFLRKYDAAAASRIHANDHQKLIRAIEMAGQTPAARRGLQGFRVLKIGLQPERAALYNRLNQRCEWMFAHGLLDETRALLASGVDPASKALATLGYRQAVAVLREEMSLNEAVARCQLRTRQYAKRQITWFRREADVCWLDGFGDEEWLQEKARALVKDFYSLSSECHTNR